ncbi:hypothetical protein QAD02_003010 [Eretmocerus hayati]|uniref:Uncharacterized protein n=1 Tax=Eretmocerus hayati TaxID=131215 RepID=A0ACC2NKW8_9HYME|nr:hypothetical protein QAD02_003010 [Eretmocerus hayati]
MENSPLNIKKTLRDDNELEAFIARYKEEFRTLVKCNTQYADGADLKYHSLTLRYECFGSYVPRGNTGRKYVSKKCGCPFEMEIVTSSEGYYVLREKNSVLVHSEKCRDTTTKFHGGTRYYNNDCPIEVKSFFIPMKGIKTNESSTNDSLAELDTPSKIYVQVDFSVHLSHSRSIGTSDAAVSLPTTRKESTDDSTSFADSSENSGDPMKNSALNSRDTQKMLTHTCSMASIAMNLPADIQ